MDPSRLEACLDAATTRLLSLRNDRGHWEGKLSAGALSTATSAGALFLVDAQEHKDLIDDALSWLARNANPDGGWGDTPRSPSNLATTLISLSALEIASARTPDQQESLSRARQWVSQKCGSLEPESIANALGRRYGKDKTFSVPILSMCALAGLLGNGPGAWGWISQLPFEAAILPHRLLRWIRLGVVSYALPALIAIGLLRHHHGPSRFFPSRWLRSALKESVLRKLLRIQPESGGFLEAAPLTGFVTMSLCSIGLEDHPVVDRAVSFLKATRRADGSWPIDTNLATWVTTLSIHALQASNRLGLLGQEDRLQLRRWLLDQQHLRVHPYTQARPGGWAWTDLSGGVPDADDTAGALLALRDLGPIDDRTRRAAQVGCRWLREVQNRDRGIATFCRGWGRLDFDRSSSDLTAHGVRAWRSWLEDLPPRLASVLSRSADAAIREFLIGAQRDDGSWPALWFGNELAHGEQNPVFGTARVLLALSGAGKADEAEESMARAVEYLLSCQWPSGGWGPENPDTQSNTPPESIEETAAAVEALACAVASRPERLDREAVIEAVGRGAARLAELTDDGSHFPAAPIGLYFARLWYYEQMYPLVMAISAWGQATRLLSPETVGYNGD